MYGFFFSSRRRHTRWPRDWSSDVCSSDLAQRVQSPARPVADGRGMGDRHGGCRLHRLLGGGGSLRSEERRVGEGGRERGPLEQAKRRREGGKESRRASGSVERRRTKKS